jgi:hypothetical protein
VANGLPAISAREPDEVLREYAEMVERPAFST